MFIVYDIYHFFRELGYVHAYDMHVSIVYKKMKYIMDRDC